MSINIFLLVLGMLLLVVLNTLITIIHSLILINKPSLIVAIKQAGNIHYTRKSRIFNPKNMLLTLQYIITILLIGSALIAGDQYRFLNDTNLGITRKKILAIPAIPDKIRDDYQMFKNQLLTSPNIINVTSCM